MPTLTDLPNEILIAIASHLRYKVGIPSHKTTYELALATLCLTCRRFRAVIQPILFGSIHLPLRPLVSDPTKPFLRLVRTLTATPKLRQAAAALDIELPSGYYVPKFPKDFDWGRVREDAVGIDAGVFGRDEEWRDGMKLRVWPHVVFLVSLLPQLQTLRVISITGGTAEPRQMHEFLGASERRKEVVLELTKSGHAEQRQGIEDLAPLMGVPTLRRTTIDNVALLGSEELVRTCFPLRSSLIEQLDLRDCPMTGSCIGGFLAGFRGLKSFSYSAWKPIEQDLFGVDEKVWHAALLPHASTLEELHLDCVTEKSLYGYNFHTVPEYELYAWPSFAPFTRLKKLEIEYRRLDMRDEQLGLPASLEKLRLLDCRNIGGAAELQYLCGIPAGSFYPGLRKVVVNMSRNCLVAEKLLTEHGFEWERGMARGERMEAVVERGCKVAFVLEYTGYYEEESA
ncbi:hypothetical protein BU26DRAFT_566505 [Trematosphaeria pertusa]|uniref:F-box domain-containing protein n=1 Tax=Trematosphaeria pertusa TaxID=390896 RepID=A0A6A6IAV0_9PLEO|nr:uncharacterized protein BU26DRAFT_566505 [Trematosphaeria pertusa]KAF2247536.1 hypothetical protein BU26DRAFT_566505 [Trematosphaeria pertusa]